MFLLEIKDIVMRINIWRTPKKRKLALIKAIEKHGYMFERVLLLTYNTQRKWNNLKIYKVKKYVPSTMSRDEAILSALERYADRGLMKKEHNIYLSSLLGGDVRLIGIVYKICRKKDLEINLSKKQIENAFPKLKANYVSGIMWSGKDQKWKLYLQRYKKGFDLSLDHKKYDLWRAIEYKTIGKYRQFRNAVRAKRRAVKRHGKWLKHKE